MLKLKDVDGAAFEKALVIWCGKACCAELGQMKQLASVADQFQMTGVALKVDMTVLENLDISVCGEVLSWSGELGLRQSEEAARRLALSRFEELVKTESFSQMSEEALERLLEDDDLAARNEEAVWEAVAGWLRRKSEEGPARGRGLVGKIRFPLMEEGYLRSRVVGMAPAEDAEWMEGVVAEALRAKAAHGDGGGFEFKLLGPKALDDRVGLGIDWYTDGGERRLKGHRADVRAIAECAGRICSGSLDGSIRVWSMTGEQGPVLVPEGRVPAVPNDGIYSLSAWEDRLMSGHSSGKLRVWNVATGACDQVLEGSDSNISNRACIRF
jgi:hypothetical protein